MVVKSFTSRYSGLSNCLINEVKISKPIKLTIIDNTSRIDSSKYNTREYHALWDTGSTCTMIIERVVNECGLIATGMVNVKSALGEEISPLFHASIWLPNRICLPDVIVTQGRLGGNIDMLIGMGIINTGDFVVNNMNGITTFSFRMPSLECIDYTTQGQSAIKDSKVREEQLCQCGSGKLFLMCHGRNKPRRRKKKSTGNQVNK